MRAWVQVVARGHLSLSEAGGCRPRAVSTGNLKGILALRAAVREGCPGRSAASLIVVGMGVARHRAVEG